MAIPPIKKGNYIKFTRGDRELRGEVYKVSKNDEGKYQEKSIRLKISFYYHKK